MELYVDRPVKSEDTNTTGEALDKHRDAFSDRRRNSLISPFIDFSDNYRRASENSVQPMATEQLSTDASVQMVASGLKGAGFDAKTISSHSSGGY